MDPVSLALAVLMKSPGVTSAARSATSPGVVNVERMQSSLADLSREVLHCYHKTARFQTTDVVASPWSRQSQYSADNSMVVRIAYSGVSGAKYAMVVAVMAKDSKVRTAVLEDSAVVRYSKQCSLENWSGG